MVETGPGLARNRHHGSSRLLWRRSMVETMRGLAWHRHGMRMRCLRGWVVSGSRLTWHWMVGRAHVGIVHGGMRVETVGGFAWNWRKWHWWCVSMGLLWGRMIELGVRLTRHGVRGRAHVRIVRGCHRRRCWHPRLLVHPVRQVCFLSPCIASGWGLARDGRPRRTQPCIMHRWQRLLRRSRRQPLLAMILVSVSTWRQWLLVRSVGNIEDERLL